MALVVGKLHAYGLLELLETFKVLSLNCNYTRRMIKAIILDKYSLSKFTKKPDKWKKHSVLIIVLASVFEKMCPHLIWEFPSYLSRKKGTSGTFLSLGLFISRPRPTASASKMRPRLQKTFPQFPFSTSVTWKNLKSDEDKFFLRLGKHNYQNKILLFFAY